ncbi:glycosyltransferase family 2 protein [Alteromonas sp. 1_MG-2023]|uniref:glycosyltransferase family 2 protein n=1 Tax=Alteromonas sp. 1_MG-2023 TaxID=3062669 RepID=UPI0026E4954D|nr:glycosyltransferase family 2 protein [Alteromonas sp. 1_MG-2023]MDO6568449.1 glycosyltransferase family 2 protein [Alteromonas sp. 1_MG-2023]
MKISIITATYNCADLLKKCLESVAEQSVMEHIEHIIVDGGSTDETLSAICKFPHVKKVFSAPDRGIYHAFNRGLAMSSGDIVYFLGADDSLYNNDVIENILKFFDNNDSDYVLTKVRCFDEETNEAWLVNTSDSIASNTCHQGFFCKASLFKRIGPFSECFKLYADSFFMKTAIANFKGVNIDLISANFRQGGASSANTSRLILKREAEAVAQLLGETATSQEAQLDKNVIDLKILLNKVLNTDHPFAEYRGMKVGIFGTRQLSLTIANALTQQNVIIVCFLQSARNDATEVAGVPVKSIKEACDVQLDIIINGVEGEHEERITLMLKERLKGTNVISWREM